MKKYFTLLLLLPLQLVAQNTIQGGACPTSGPSQILQGTTSSSKTLVASSSSSSTVRVGGRNCNTAVTGIPYYSDLMYLYNTRNGSYFVDTLGRDSAEILIPEFKGTGTTVYLIGDKTRTAEHILDGNDYTIYFRMKQTDAVSTTTYSQIHLGRLTTGMGVRFYLANGRVYINVNDGSTNINSNPIYGVDTILYTKTYVDFVIQVNGTTKDIDVYIYDKNGVLLNTNTSGVKTNAATNIDISGLTLNTNDNQIAYTFFNQKSVITNFKKYSGLKNRSLCLNDSTVSGLQIHYPSVYSGTDISGNANHMTRSTTGYDVFPSYKYYTSINTWTLDNGFNDLELLGNDTMSHKQVAYQYDGDKILEDYYTVGSWISGFRRSAERDGSDKYINQNDCKIKFTNSFFNRKNATIWGAACRASKYYSATDTMTWHISELNQRTIYEWLNNGYKGRLFVQMSDNSIEKWDRKLLKGIYLYTTDHKNEENKSILEWTGDYFAHVPEIYDANGYVELGYLQATEPMLSLRIDDGYVNAITQWKPMLDSFNVDPICGIHSDLCGQTVGAYSFMSWAQRRTLKTAGWETADDNPIDNDYKNVKGYDSIYYFFTHQRQLTLDSLSITLKIYDGNRYSSNDISATYIAHKLGYDAHIVAGPLSGNHATNLKHIDLFNVSCMSIDLDFGYNLDKPDHAAELQLLKDQLDIAAANNRWAIFYFHGYTAYVRNGLADLLNYAATQNISIVTPTQAINSLIYDHK